MVLEEIGYKCNSRITSLSEIQQARLHKLPWHTRAIFEFVSTFIWNYIKYIMQPHHILHIYWMQLFDICHKIKTDSWHLSHTVYCDVPPKVSVTIFFLWNFFFMINRFLMPGWILTLPLMSFKYMIDSEIILWNTNTLFSKS